MKARLVPLQFEEMNEREQDEFREQMKLLTEMYADVAQFEEPVKVGEEMPEGADAAVFPLLIFAAYRHDEQLISCSLPMIILTSEYGTIEMWGLGDRYLSASAWMQGIYPLQRGYGKNNNAGFCCKKKACRRCQIFDVPGYTRRRKTS